MNLLQCRLRVEFANPMGVSSLAELIHKELTQQDLKVPKINETGFNIIFRDDKMFVHWNPKFADVYVERFDNHQVSLNKLNFVLEQVDKVHAIIKTANIRFFTCWMIATPKYTFVELEEKYRNTMIKQNNLFESVFDSSVIVETKIDNELVLHHQSGPMEPKQLMTSYLKFPYNEVPQSFLFLETCVRNSNLLEYSREAMLKFINLSFEHCNKHQELFSKIWEGLL